MEVSWKSGIPALQWYVVVPLTGVAKGLYELGHVSIILKLSMNRLDNPRLFV